MGGGLKKSTAPPAPLIYEIIRRLASYKFILDLLLNIEIDNVSFCFGGPLNFFRNVLRDHVSCLSVTRT